MKLRLWMVGRLVRRVDWRKRLGMRAKGMERNCMVRGVDALVRPVSGPRRGCSKVWPSWVDIVSK